MLSDAWLAMSIKEYFAWLYNKYQQVRFDVTYIFIFVWKYLGEFVKVFIEY